MVAIAIATPAAAEYFVAPTGNDAAPGTEAKPWRTVDKAGATAMDGDVVTFLPGEYPGTLAPKHDGELGRPVMFRSQKPLKAKLVGGNPVVKLDGRRHIVIHGFHVAPVNGTYLLATQCEYVLLSQCALEGSRGTYVAARFVECRYVWLVGNLFTRLLNTSKGAVLSGNMIQADRCDRLVLERNTIGKAGHSPAHLRECTHLVVRGNLFCAKWGRGFETFNATPMLFDGNVITEEVDSGGSADSRGKLLATDGIVRHNLVVRNYDAALASNSYIYRKGMPAWVLRNSRLYNNTLHRNHSYAWIITAMAADLTTVSGNVWANNVFCDNDPHGDGRALRLGYLGEGNRFVRNVFYADRPGRKVIQRWAGRAGNRTFTLGEAEKELGALFADNLDVDPRFVDAEADDYRLAADSPCVDAGRFLAKTTRAGSGRELPVDDARWFYDGFDIPLQQGDLVFVGAGRSAARVVRADHKANVLLLDSDVEWQAGDAVSLPYLGRAPDLGAMERGAEKEKWFHRLAVPKGVRWHPPGDPEAPLVETDFEDATLEQWGCVWNLDRKRNTAYARVKDTAAGGTWSLRLQATADGSILAGDVKPRIWEIDRYPVIRLSYRIPKGVPVGLWLDCFDTEKWGDGRVCVGGTASRHAGGAKDLGRRTLIDDDAWHTATLDARLVREAFPGVTHLQGFQLYTHRNGKKGQGFRVDDFSIRPK